MLKWKQLSWKSIIKNHWMQVHKDTVQLPSHIVTSIYIVPNFLIKIKNPAHERA